jgi:voltage-gated potassium channel
MKEGYKYVLGICVIFLAESIALYLFEGRSNEDLDTLPKALWWFIIFLCSGFEVLPKTAGGKIIGTFLVIEGLGLLGVIFGGVAAFFVEKSLSGGKIMKRIRFKDHILVCGWTPNTPKILDELTSEDIKTKRKIVVLADLGKNPLGREDIKFVRGDPTRDEDLRKAGIMHANTAIITLDRSSDNPDAKAILIALAVESLNRDVYTCVELENPENEKHLVHAHVDEIVCLGRLSQNLLVHSSVDHGLSRLYSELVTYDIGYEFYKISVPRQYVGDSFPTALKRLLDEEDAILVAVDRKSMDEYGETEMNILINPGPDFILQEEDNIFVIAREEPEIQ